MELRSLELDCVNLTIGELTAVLENCPVLEVLRVRNGIVFSDEDEHGLRSKFARIKTMTLECDDNFRYGSDWESNDYDFERDDNCRYGSDWESNDNDFDNVLDFADEMSDGSL